MNSDIQRVGKTRWITKIFKDRNILFTVIVEGHDDKKIYQRLIDSEKLDYFPCEKRVDVRFNEENDSRGNNNNSGKLNAIKVIKELVELCTINRCPMDFFLAIVDKDFDGVINKKDLEKQYRGNIIYTDGTDLESMVFFVFYQKKFSHLETLAKNTINTSFDRKMLKFVLTVAREVSALMVKSQNSGYCLPISNYFSDIKRFKGLINFKNESFNLEKFIKDLEARRKKPIEKGKQYTENELIESVHNLLNSKRFSQKCIIHGKTLFRILDFASIIMGLNNKKMSCELKKNFTTDLFKLTSTHQKIFKELKRSPVLN